MSFCFLFKSFFVKSSSTSIIFPGKSIIILNKLNFHNKCIVQGFTHHLRDLKSLSRLRSLSRISLLSIIHHLALLWVSGGDNKLMWWRCSTCKKKSTRTHPSYTKYTVGGRSLLRL